MKQTTYAARSRRTQLDGGVIMLTGEAHQKFLAYFSRQAAIAASAMATLATVSVFKSVKGAILPIFACNCALHTSQQRRKAYRTALACRLQRIASLLARERVSEAAAAQACASCAVGARPRYKRRHNVKQGIVQHNELQEAYATCSHLVVNDNRVDCVIEEAAGQADPEGAIIRPARPSVLQCCARTCCLGEAHRCTAAVR